MNQRQRASPRDIRALFPSNALTPEEARYLDYHAARIAFAVNLVAECIERIRASTPRVFRILDVGPHFLTAALRARFTDAVRLTTLGWANDRLAPAHLVDRHYDFDLNDVPHRDRWPAVEPQDVIVLAEVIEHLYTSPRLVLRFLHALLQENGVLVIQTPNAVWLRHRIKMLLGRNPYEQIRETRDNPGHFREYTAGELRDLCRDAGLVPERVIHADYWPVPLVLRPLQWLNPRLRAGLTVLARRDSAGSGRSATADAPGQQRP